MTIRIRTLASSFIALTVTGLALAAATPRVYDDGMGEGDTMNRYRVICPSDKRTLVDNFFLTGEVCYYRASDSARQCLRGASVDDAAARACNE